MYMDINVIGNEFLSGEAALAKLYSLPLPIKVSFKGKDSVHHKDDFSF